MPHLSAFAFLAACLAAVTFGALLWIAPGARAGTPVPARTTTTTTSTTTTTVPAASTRLAGSLCSCLAQVPRDARNRLLAADMSRNAFALPRWSGASRT